MLRPLVVFWNRPFPFVRNFVLWISLLLFVRLSAFADQSVTLSWNSSSDTNVVGYKIHYGGASQVYTNTVICGNVTNVTISGLSAGATYYFAATAFDGSGTESAFSNEAMYAVPQAAANPPMVYQPPTLDPIPNLTIYENAGPQTVALTGISSGSNGS